MLLPDVSNKDANQMPNICHMSKFHNVHQWEKYANIHVKYELTTISDVARNAIHKQWMTALDNNDYYDDTTAKLHRLSCPLSQISQT